MAMAKLLLHGTLFLFLFLATTTTTLVVVVEGREFIVGGRVHAWKAPSPAAAAHHQTTLNQWASSLRFQVGDTLVWVLGGSQTDSVLEVARPDYLTCNTSSPLADHTYGTARVRLDRPGVYYFISGINGACQKGEKLAVLVMGPHHHSLAPSPSPSPSTGFDDVVVGSGPAAAAAAAPPTSGASGRMVVGAANVVGLGLLMLLLGLRLL